MRRFRRSSLLAAVAAIALASPLYAASPAHTGAGPILVHFSEAEKADLKRISAYLNTIKSVQGHFTQVNADGKTEQGTFYLKKPGRMRFEYQKPNPNLIIADGTTVAVENADLKTTDRYPLVNSPLRLLLSENIDLTTDSHVSALKREQGAISVTARENSAVASGSITLTLADSGGSLELRQWEVVDAQGAHTTVVLNDVRETADIPARLFVIEDLSPFKKNGR
ncbi:MAG TPA: outer-membrane lipoprotein carrier protein LolA [Micropepsaceae bacterium]|jgi:outer membrane lipoprotein-sorting protein|nr:outer-membrane lipoprotein carrier protein LolA [Micropepsaceae bacterium]